MDLQVIAMSIVSAIVFVTLLEKIDKRYAATFIITYLIVVPILIYIIVRM